MLEPYVVTEELLAAGAPVVAHWIADRQSAPLLLRSGTEEQRLAFLPGNLAGEPRDHLTAGRDGQLFGSVAERDR